MADRVTHPIRVLLVRGRHATTWGLRAWESLPAPFEAACLVTRRNLYDLASVGLERVEVRALRDLLPPGRVCDLLAGLAGDRYLGAGRELRRADIVHTEEISFWFGAQVARLKPRHCYKLVLTVWETLPLLGAFRHWRARRYRRTVLPAVEGGAVRHGACGGDGRRPSDPRERFGSYSGSARIPGAPVRAG